MFISPRVSVLDYATFPEQRQALIFQILQENDKVVCSELTSRLGVSEHTIRCDLHELSKDGICKKVYGGVITTLPESEDIGVRKSINVAKKNDVAQRCARLVKSGSCIFIDTGNTSLAMVGALPVELALTVVANSSEIAAVLLEKPLFEVIMLGGMVQRSSGGYVGASAIAQMQDILFDQGFTGGYAMSPESGLTGFDYADCEFRKAVIKQCNGAIVTLAAEEIPAVARYVVTEGGNIDAIVVEGNISKEYATTFQAHDIRICTV